PAKEFFTGTIVGRPVLDGKVGWGLFFHDPKINIGSGNDHRKLHSPIVFPDKGNTQARLFTMRVSFDFWLAAFFQWITFFLASLSIMDVTSFSNAVASSLDVAALSFLIAVRVDLC